MCVESFSLSLSLEVQPPPPLTCGPFEKFMCNLCSASRDECRSSWRAEKEIHTHQFPHHLLNTHAHLTSHIHSRLKGLLIYTGLLIIFVVLVIALYSPQGCHFLKNIQVEKIWLIFSGKNSEEFGIFFISKVYFLGE